ncbi:MAG: BMP family ABC transporter substrate-binding protein [Anaerolineales bacterium]|nr:BMP family ABC transporter substrate-binding protein [Anaerolineales bacterium]
MSRKLFTVLIVMLAALLVLTACDALGAGTGSGDCADEETLCVALVTDVGTIDDKSFNQSAWEAVQQAEADLGAQIDFIETADAKDYGANIQLFLDQNYDIIVTSGFAMGTATAEAAQANPDTVFIGTDQFQAEVIPNYTGIIFPEDQSGFLAGALAAMLNESGTIAGVYGTDLVPPVVAFKVGYENGAAYINPDINVISTFHPGGLDVAFVDPEWGAATARQAIDQGADVVFGAGGLTGNGAIIETAVSEGLWCIGVDTDQWETVPEAHSCLVTSAMKLITPAVYNLIVSATEGNVSGGNFVGPVGLAPFHDFDSEISQDIKDTLADIDAGLKDGSISTNYNPGG